MSLVVTKFSRFDKNKSGRGGYLNYIGLREGVEISNDMSDKSSGYHGVFSDYSTNVSLPKVVDELNTYDGNVFGIIISLKRKNAESAGLTEQKKWQDMLCANQNLMSKVFQIPLMYMKWYASYHDETYHPHVHVLVHSSRPNEGWLCKEAINEFRDEVTKYVNAHMGPVTVVKVQPMSFDKIKKKTDKVLEAVEKGYSNPEIDNLINELSIHMSNSNQKRYSDISKKSQETVDKIMKALSEDPLVNELYILWYEQEENKKKHFKSVMPERIPLYNNKAFRSLKSIIISVSKEPSEKKGRILMQKVIKAILDKINIFIPDSISQKQQFKKVMKNKKDSNEMSV